MLIKNPFILIFIILVAFITSRMTADWEFTHNHQMLSSILTGAASVSLVAVGSLAIKAIKGKS